MARGLCEDYRSEAGYACFEEGRLEFVAGLPHLADRVSRNQTRYRLNILQPILQELPEKGAPFSKTPTSLESIVARLQPQEGKA